MRPKILIIDDEQVFRESVAEVLATHGFDVVRATSGDQALKLFAEAHFDLAVCDIEMPGTDGISVLERAAVLAPETGFIMATAFATVENTVRAFQLGAVDYIVKPIIFEDLIIKLNRLLELRRLNYENAHLRRQLEMKKGTDLLIGTSREIRKIREVIEKLAPTRTTVLVTGESGTGKEVVAQAIHMASTPKDPFLAINLGSVPDTLAESTLFGHVKGAFTGAAHEREGILIAAGKGTVFLDEIGEAPIELQVKLLRALELNEVLPVGSDRPVQHQARIIAATNRDLKARIAERLFREDLYYRLTLIELTVPPLRERLDDIPYLVERFVNDAAARHHKPPPTLTNAAMRQLLHFAWPGNVRQLKNAIERAILFSDDNLIGPDDLPDEITGGADFPAAHATVDTLKEAVASFEDAHIQRVLGRCGGNKRVAAERLGIGLSSLYRKLGLHDHEPEHQV